MSWLPSGKSELEKKILVEVNSDELFKHVEFLSKFDRISGGPGEAKAIEYVKKKLEEYGVPIELYEFESLLSYPIAAELEVTAPEKTSVECITHAFSTSGDEIGELVYVGSGYPEDYEKVNVKGKIVLCDGITAGLERMPEEHEALASVHIREKYVNEDIVTLVWGTPSSRWAHLIPGVPVVSVNKKHGEFLRELVKSQHVEVRVKATTDTAWRKITLTVASIPGTVEPEKYVLIGGHIDSWHEGATDNATGNATCLELARVLMKYQKHLKRGVKIAWWPGHSTGRYSGSTWYADNFWLDLHENCLAYINIDSPGVKGGTIREPSALSEVLQLAEATVEDVVGTRGESRWGKCKMGDQSFLGIGIPSVSFYTSIPKQHDVYGSGGAWWWHTVHDTFDKADKEMLALDTKVYAALANRLCTYPVFPFNFNRVAKEYIQTLTKIQDDVGSLFDLSPALKLAKTMKEKIEKLNTTIEKMIGYSKEPTVFQVINFCLLQLSRILNPVLHTEFGKYDQDPAVMFRQIPLLQQVLELKTLNPSSSEFRFLKTHLIRQRNQVVHTLNTALITIKNTIDTLAKL
ncbi:MAG: M28 family peptidase [Promethearchaeota archaeon]